MSKEASGRSSTAVLHDGCPTCETFVSNCTGQTVRKSFCTRLRISIMISNALGNSPSVGTCGAIPVAPAEWKRVSEMPARRNLSAVWILHLLTLLVVVCFVAMPTAAQYEVLGAEADAVVNKFISGQEAELGGKEY